MKQAAPVPLLVCLVFCANLAMAQTPIRATVLPLQSRIVIDGRLEEGEWTSAVPIGELLQRESREGKPASERTEVRLLYDAANLYIGVKCFDSEPGRITGTQMARIDTFRDRRNAFYFCDKPGRSTG